MTFRACPVLWNYFLKLWHFVRFYEHHLYSKFEFHESVWFDEISSTYFWSNSLPNIQHIVFKVLYNVQYKLIKNTRNLFIHRTSLYIAIILIELQPFPWRVLQPLASSPYRKSHSSELRCYRYISEITRRPMILAIFHHLCSNKNWMGCSCFCKEYWVAARVLQLLANISGLDIDQ